jgi:cobalt-zinc-cadmium resistance protein CzcA
VALALIFMLLYFTFSSVKQATLIYTAIPMSAIGGVFALLLRDMPFSISAGVGFIALFGVAVLNGIVLIGTFNQLEKDGVKDIIQRIKEGTKIRLRPVLMTATVASLGFLPMALSHGAGAEVQKPLATVVIGGLLTATFLTLFVLPLLYLIFSTKRKIKIPSVAVLVVAIFTFNNANAQTTPKQLSIEDAISIALKNNLELQSQQLNVQSSQSLKKSVFELPKTNFNLQYGQYNSINQDLGFQINQSIPFPTYYSAKSNLYKAELQGSQLQQQATANEIKAQVQYWFYQLQYLQQTKKQLQSLDSLYNDFVSVAALRYQTGETNLLEKTTAETKGGQLSLLLKQNETDYTTGYASLKTLLNTSEDFTVSDSGNFQPFTLSNSFDTSLVANNPSLKVLYQQAIIAEQNKKVETASTLPDFNVGYFNQSLIGTQTINGTDVFFNGSKRFQGLNVGISIPLTFLSNAQKIKSLSFNQQALQKEADNGKLILQTQLQNAFAQYNQNLSQYNYFKATALPNADIIISTATLGFKSGDIGYIEYLQALQTATDVQLNYLQSVNQVNQSIININFLINN